VAKLLLNVESVNINVFVREISGRKVLKMEIGTYL